MSEIDPASESIVEDVRRKIQEKAAVNRGETWERLGCPTAKNYMPLAEYEREFRGRMWFANKQVFEQAQQALRIILCPKCVEEADYGAIKGTRFYITVEDDVMAVFPAVGHFVCHHCGFEEWHPLKHDPRVANQAMGSDMADALRYQFASAGVSRNQQLVDQIQALREAAGKGLINEKAAIQHIGRGLSAGINPGMGPIWGMTEEEKRALHRLYQQTNAAKSAPPPIVQSKEEAEMLLKLAPIERRQAIIQKLRDKGMI